MAYLVRTLIKDAYELSGIVGEGLEIVTSSQTAKGLRLLNELLVIKTANSKLVPYYTHYTLTLTPNVGTYFIPNLIEAETVTFNLQEVRYSMIDASRYEFFGLPRVDNISALPFSFRIEREKGGSTLYLYFLPLQDYVLKIFGKFALTTVSISDDLEDSLDDFYIAYLRYALADYIAQENGKALLPLAQAKLGQLEQLMANIGPTDTKMRKISTLQTSSTLNWGQINLGRGWTIP